MFERYDERARRAVFFARYEASQRDSAYIEPEDLLLGLLRESPVLAEVLKPEKSRRMSEQLRELKPLAKQPSTTSVDLPLNAVTKRALAYAAEEAESHSHKTITSGHLVLGILRVFDSMASQVLNEAGIHLEMFRELVCKASVDSRSVRLRAAPAVAPARSRSLAPLLDSLYFAVSTVAGEFYSWTPEECSGTVKGDESWTRKEAFGHLIDLAIANQQRLAAALADEDAPGYVEPTKAWVDVQHYSHRDWDELVDLWISVNRHLIKVIDTITEDKLVISCRAKDAEPLSLQAVISGYVQSVNDWLGRMAA